MDSSPTPSEHASVARLDASCNFGAGAAVGACLQYFDDMLEDIWTAPFAARPYHENAKRAHLGQGLRTAY